MRKLRFHLVSLSLVWLCGLFSTSSAQDAVTKSADTIGAFPVHIKIDAAKPMGELKPIWRFFGADEPNYAYMKDGQKLIAELGAAAAERRLLSHAQPADLRRRHAGA